MKELDLRPEETVFLDDLGGNLKSARQLGIRTIKVQNVYKMKISLHVNQATVLMKKYCLFPEAVNFLAYTVFVFVFFYKDFHLVFVNC